MTSIKKEYLDRVQYINEQGQFHREDGPAVEWNNGNKSWYINGRLHRLDGPAIEYYNGFNGDKRWYLNGQKFSKEEWEQEVAKIKLKRILDL
jgi:hypothetical protein